MNTLEAYTAQFIEKNFPEKKGLFSFIGKKKRQQKRDEMQDEMAKQFTSVAEFYHQVGVGQTLRTLGDKCKNEKGKFTKQIGRHTISRTHIPFKP